MTVSSLYWAPLHFAIRGQETHKNSCAVMPFISQYPIHSAYTQISMAGQAPLHNSYVGTDPIHRQSTMKKFMYHTVNRMKMFLFHIPSFRMYKGTQRPIARVQGPWPQQSLT